MELIQCHVTFTERYEFHSLSLERGIYLAQIVEAICVAHVCELPSRSTTYSVSICRRPTYDSRTVLLCVYGGTSTLSLEHEYAITLNCGLGLDNRNVLCTPEEVTSSNVGNNNLISETHFGSCHVKCPKHRRVCSVCCLEVKTTILILIDRLAKSIVLLAVDSEHRTILCSVKINNSSIDSLQILLCSLSLQYVDSCLELLIRSSSILTYSRNFCMGSSCQESLCISYSRNEQLVKLICLNISINKFELLCQLVKVLSSWASSKKFLCSSKVISLSCREEVEFRESKECSTCACAVYNKTEMLVSFLCGNYLRSILYIRS